MSIKASIDKNSKLCIGRVLGKPIVIGNADKVSENELLVELDDESDDIICVKQRGNRITGKTDKDGFETIIAREGYFDDDDTEFDIDSRLSSITITKNGTYRSAKGYGYNNVIVAISNMLQSKTVIPTSERQLIKADEGYDALRQVTVEAVPSTTLNVTLKPIAQEINSSEGVWFDKVVIPEAQSDSEVIYNESQKKLTFNNTRLIINQ